MTTRSGCSPRETDVENPGLLSRHPYLDRKASPTWPPIPNLLFHHPSPWTLSMPRTAALVAYVFINARDSRSSSVGMNTSGKASATLPCTWAVTTPQSLHTLSKKCWTISLFASVGLGNPNSARASLTRYLTNLCFFCLRTRRVLLDFTGAYAPSATTLVR